MHVALRVGVLAASMLALSACQKKPAAEPAPAPVAEAPAPAPAPTPAPAPAPAADPAAAEKQAKLDYATMEDGYLNDPKGQWGSEATASSSTSDDPDRIQNAKGAPDGRSWTQKSQDIGFDWIQLVYANPVHATEVRVVTAGNTAAEALTKVELIDTGGQPHVVWSGVSDVKPDARGSRTWFVRKFDKTAYQVKAVKVTYANNVSTGYKDTDAVQLVGE